MAHITTKLNKPSNHKSVVQQIGFQYIAGDNDDLANYDSVMTSSPTINTVRTSVKSSDRTPYLQNISNNNQQSFGTKKNQYILDQLDLVKIHVNGNLNGQVNEYDYDEYQKDHSIDKQRINSWIQDQFGEVPGTPEKIV